MTIHDTSVVGSDAVIGAGATIGPFCVVGCDGDTPPLVAGERLLMRSHSVIYRGCRVGNGVHIGHGALVREETTIGDDVSVGSHTVVEHHVTLGDGVRLHSRCFVPELSVIQAGAWLGPGVIITNARYPNRPDTKNNLEGVLIQSEAVIGAGAVLLPGVTVGAGALVGAGAVVVKSVAPGDTVVGNPSRMIVHRP